MAFKGAKLVLAAGTAAVAAAAFTAANKDLVTHTSQAAPPSSAQCLPDTFAYAAKHPFMDDQMRPIFEDPENLAFRQAYEKRTEVEAAEAIQGWLTTGSDHDFLIACSKTRAIQGSIPDLSVTAPVWDKIHGMSLSVSQDPVKYEAVVLRVKAEEAGRQAVLAKLSYDRALATASIPASTGQTPQPFGKTDRLRRAPGIKPAR